MDRRGGAGEVGPLDLAAVRVLRQLAEKWTGGPRGGEATAQLLHRDVLASAGPKALATFSPNFLPRVFSKLLTADRPEGDMLKFHNFCALCTLALPRLLKAGKTSLAQPNDLELLRRVADESLRDTQARAETQLANAAAREQQETLQRRQEAEAGLFRMLSRGESHCRTTDLEPIRSCDALGGGAWLLRLWLTAVAAGFWGRFGRLEDSQVSVAEFVDWIDVELPRDEIRFIRVVERLEAAAQLAVDGEAKSPKQQLEQAQDASREARRRAQRLEAYHCSSRKQLLRAVHREMDPDQSDYIEAPELMLLGQARRQLGHKSGEWTEDKNCLLMGKLDVSGDGHVGPCEFATYFNTTLPGDPDAFMVVIEQFMEVARACRQRKEAAAEAQAAMERQQAKSRAIEREAMLEAVHREMDPDQSGYIEAPELMLLGQARRQLGHKSGEWTEDKNRLLMGKLDVSGDGHVGPCEFATYFNTTLPGDPDAFMVVIEQFMEVARACRQRKVAAAEAQAAMEVRAARHFREERARADAPPMAVKAESEPVKCNNETRADITPERKAAPKQPAIVPECKAAPKQPAITPERKAAPKQPAIVPERRKAAPKQPVDNLSLERRKLLVVVHNEMDSDQSGYIQAPELMLLGQARMDNRQYVRQLGHRIGKWTPEMNERQMRKMDVSGVGHVGASEFAEYFDDTLPGDPDAFMVVIEQFMEVARGFKKRTEMASEDWRESDDYEQRLQQAEDLARLNAVLKMQRWWWRLWENDIRAATHTANWLSAQEESHVTSGSSGYSPPEAVSRGSRAQWIEEQEMMHAFNDLGASYYVPNEGDSEAHEQFMNELEMADLENSELLDAFKADIAS